MSPCADAPSVGREGRPFRGATHTSAAWAQGFEPLVLKEVSLACGLGQGELARRLAEALGRPVSRATANLTVNRGYVPATIEGYRAAVEAVLGHEPAAVAWLAERGLGVADLWRPAASPHRNTMPMGVIRRSAATQRRNREAEAARRDPDAAAHLAPKEVPMLTPAALRHFKLFRHPFVDDVQKDADVFLSEEHRYIEAAMIDAARHGGFLAVIGEVGSGKSVIRRKVVEQLKRDADVLVIYPQMIDKGRLTASSICDAVVQDVSSERCKSKLEDKTRQVQRLLLDRAKSGYRACLIIEEAHDLSVPTLKYLKRFYELEDGYRKLLGIVLIGQTELKHRFDEGQNIDMREVIRRVQVAEIAGLNGHLADYLGLKFRRLGRDVADIFTPDAFEALSRRLTTKSRDGRTSVSHAYPLLVNNYAARAMNLAHELGEARVTADVVEAL